MGLGFVVGLKVIVACFVEVLHYSLIECVKAVTVSFRDLLLNFGLMLKFEGKNFRT